MIENLKEMVEKGVSNGELGLDAELVSDAGLIERLLNIKPTVDVLSEEQVCNNIYDYMVLHFCKERMVFNCNPQFEDLLKNKQFQNLIKNTVLDADWVDNLKNRFEKLEDELNGVIESNRELLDKEIIYEVTI